MMAATLLSLFCAATPSVGLGLGQATERLEVTGAHETRRLLTSSLALGLEYPLADGALEGLSTLAVGLVFDQGQVPLQLDQGLRARWQRGWFGVFGGVGAGLTLNLSDPALSSAHLSLPVGLTLGPVEVLWAPRVQVPLAHHEEDVFGGVRRHGAALGLELLSLQVRLRIDRLRF
ncbi:MAG: hypothetical protein H6730_28605 [Deltaproteobacteria bacterium]|nr:hypothetical protein [Deltaproteobacteria bacterium]